MHRVRLLKLIISTSVALMLITLSGCESKFADLSNTELSSKMAQCRANQSPSPGFAIACDNITKECATRRKKKNFIC